MCKELTLASMPGLRLRPLLDLFHSQCLAWQSCLQVKRLYSGQQDEEICEHMRACNPRGPLLVHIAKLYPKQDCSTFDAFGRVFSGTVKAGDRVP